MTGRLHFDETLKELRNTLIKMGQQVEQAIDTSIRALMGGDLVLARSVIDDDIHINHMEHAIDEMGTSLIATQQPVARDLRRILIAFKIAADLERMGDLAVDIAKTTIRIGDQRTIEPPGELSKMAHIVQGMTKDSLQAYIGENIDLAYKMALIDDEVDLLHGQILRDMVSHIVDDPKSMNDTLLLCFISRYLERMADHATNIGESVVYLVKGTRPDLNQ